MYIKSNYESLKLKMPYQIRNIGIGVERLYYHSEVLPGVVAAAVDEVFNTNSVRFAQVFQLLLGSFIWWISSAVAQEPKNQEHCIKVNRLDWFDGHIHIIMRGNLLSPTVQTVN